jgi:hypothetical protein
VARIKPGKGDTFLFWLDSWKLKDSSICLKDRFPRLFSFVLNDSLSASQVYEMEDISSIFFLPLSVQAHGELNELQVLMADNPLSEQNDVWSYIWGEKYYAAKFYEYIHSHIQVPKVYHWLWKSSCVMSVKMFAWLLLRDRLNTKDLIHRRHWNVTDEYHCVLCPLRAHEDRIHLFFSAISASVFGTIYKLNGLVMVIFNPLLVLLGGALASLFSWRWLLWLVGRFG